MWHESYLIKQAMTWDELKEKVVGRHGISELASSPPILMAESVTGKHLEPEGLQGAALAFLSPDVYLLRLLDKRKKAKALERFNWRSES